MIAARIAIFIAELIKAAAKLTKNVAEEGIFVADISRIVANLQIIAACKFNFE